MLADIQKDTVDFAPNYDGTTESPWSSFSIPIF